MKTRAFQIRVLICFFLSLIPATDLENLVYSARMQLRGGFGRPSNLVVVDVDPGDFTNPFQLRALQKQIQTEEPLLVLIDAANPAEKPKDLLVDSDGVVRRALLHARQGLPPPPARLLKQPHYINFQGPAGTIPHCDWGSLSSASACQSMKGKIVVIGEEPEPTALLRTPLGEMSRSEVLANDLNTILNRHEIHEASWWVRSALILTMVLLGAFYIIYYPVFLSAFAVVGTGIVIVIVLFQLVFQLLDFYIPSLNVAFSLLITYLTFTGYRLAHQENLQWRSLKQAQYLKELDQLKTNFLSLLSHDLKTPLAKIQAGVDRLRREISLPPGEKTDLRDVAESLENSHQELRRYIESILSLSKIESQKVHLNKKSNDINRVIEFALKRLRPLAQAKGIRIEADLEPLFAVECDEDLMRQVVSNLIDNAIKYSPEGSRVIVRSREEDGFIRVDVEDFGPGIPKDQLPLVFRKFSRFFRPQGQGIVERGAGRRVDASSPISQVRGTGLGLYLSKYFIELHGGSIRLKTVEGQGTIFTFNLPVEPPCNSKEVVDDAMPSVTPRALTQHNPFDSSLRHEHGAQS